MITLQERTIPAVGLVHQIEALSPAAWQPAHELIQTERGLTLSIDLPGVIPQNLYVDCHSGRLYVWDRRDPTHCPKALDHASTRAFGDFALDVEIPVSADLRRASKTYKDGVLTVLLPNRRESQPSVHALG